MDQTEILSRLTVSLAIGLLVGLERGWRTRDEDDHQRAAGLRTFALTGLLGGISGAIGQKAGMPVIGLIFLGHTAAFTAFHWLEARAENDLSVTSVIAGMLTFLLGCLAVVGDLGVAIACAVAMTVLLALREQLHRWVASLTWPEIRAVLTLLAMSFLLLPVMPDRAIDPWNVLNPYQIWLLAVMIAAISFAGYVGVRVFGDRLGVLMAAVTGGLASSTATTLALARLAREHPASSNLLGAGILIAGLVMMARVGIVASLLNGALAWRLAPPLAAAGLALAAGAGLLLFLGNRQRESPRLRIDNPLALGTALKLAALIGLVTLAAELLRRQFGDIGVLMVAAATGLADVDTITISMARLGGGEIDPDMAALAILTAVAVNTLSKAGLAAYAGGTRIGVKIGAVSLVALACGFIAARGLPVTTR